MTLRAAIVSAAAASGTPTYTQDFADATAFNGDTLKLALALAGRTTSENTNTAGVTLNIGAVSANGAGDAGIAISNNDAVSTNTSAYAVSATQGYSSMRTGASTDGDATIALAADKATFSWTDQSASEIIKVLGLSGDIATSVVARANVAGTGTENHGIAHSLGGTPEAIICLTVGQATGANNGQARIGLGFWTAAAQHCVGWHGCANAQATVNSSCRISTTQAICNPGTGTSFVWAGTISNVGATTFDITYDVSNTSAVIFICLRSTSGTALGAKVGTLTSPTSTGDVSITGLTQAGQVLLTATTLLTAVDTGNTGSEATALSVGVACKNSGTDATQYACVANSENDGAATSTNHARSQSSNTQLVRVLNTSGGTTLEATVGSWNSDGATVTFSKVDASARKGIYLILGADGAPAGGAGTGTISYVASGTGVTAASGTTLSPAWPAGQYSLGDDAIATCFSRVTGDTWSTASSGWEKLTTTESNGICKFRKTAVSTSEAAPTFTRSGSSSAMIAQISVFRGLHATLASLVEDVATGGDGTASNDIATASPGTPTEDACLVMYDGKWHDNIGGASFSAPAGSTKLHETQISTGSGLTAVSSYAIQTTAANVGASSFDNSGANTALDYSVVSVLRAEPSPTAGTPVVSEVSTVQVGATFTVTGTNFSASGNVVTLGGVTQTITSESPTSITCAAVSLGSLRYGEHNLVVNNSDGLADLVLVDLTPAATASYVNLAGTLVPSGNRPTSSSDLAAGDQIEYSTPVNGTLAGCVIDPTGWAGMDPTDAGLACSFDYRVHDGTGWGTSATITFNVPSYGASSAARPRVQRRPRQRRVLNLGR